MIWYGRLKICIWTAPGDLQNLVGADIPLYARSIELCIAQIVPRQRNDIVFTSQRRKEQVPMRI